MREAIELANANSGADSIAFDPLLAGATINLTGSELQVTETLTIDASALTANVTIDAQQQSRVLRVSSSVTADLSGLTLTGGLADRGAGLRVDSSSTVTLTDVVVRGNESTSTGFDSGGGIWNTNGSTLTILDSVITDNTSAGNGGGMWNRGNLSIARSTISGNTATGSFSSGGGVVNYLGNLTITDSTLSGNSSTYNGGAIYSVASADLATTATRIVGSTISGNTAANGGGLFNYLGLTRDPLQHDHCQRGSAAKGTGRIMAEHGCSLRRELDVDLKPSRAATQGVIHAPQGILWKPHGAAAMSHELPGWLLHRVRPIQPGARGLMR